MWLPPASLCFCRLCSCSYSPLHTLTPLRPTHSNPLAPTRYQVVLYQALTGRLCWVLGTHSGMVHSMSWAKDDSALVTASADFTAKVNDY